MALIELERRGIDESIVGGCSTLLNLDVHTLGEIVFHSGHSGHAGILESVIGRIDRRSQIGNDLQGTIDRIQGEFSGGILGVSSGRSTIENKLHTIVGPGVERSGHSTTLGAGDMRSDDRLIRSHCPVRGDSIGLIIIALIERLPIELKAHEERVPIAEPLDGDGSLC